ncbi:MAG: Crp/Fnr family transcriptional regulator [Pseudomonadota bacterium]|nr:Crp/Fnr family transcriptional regulator [Pseudomonadota bacterium]
MLLQDRRIAQSSLLLSGLGADVTDDILAGAQVQDTARASTIFLQGDPARRIFIVLDGWVKLYRMTPAGTEAVVGVFTRGHSFGEAVAFRGDLYPVSAEAVTACRLVSIDAGHILGQIQKTPEIAVSILAATFTHLHALVQQVEGLKARTGPQRVAEFLLELADCQSGTCTVQLPYDKVLIAGRLGMKPESLSRAFAKLREHGVTIRNNSAEITDMTALAAFVADDPANAWTR